MGQLDEAIRAHLELKRKHGASEEELHAKEQEALGPVRRETGAGSPAPEEQPVDDLAEPHATAEAPDLYAEPLEELPPEAFHESVEPLVDPGPQLDPDFTEPHERVEAAQETVEFIEATEAMRTEEALEAADAVDPQEAHAGQTPPRGFDAVEEPPVEGDEEEGEDVLEETPDFLQETPEHDRLWFEQKPPRDFDFDE